MAKRTVGTAAYSGYLNPFRKAKVTGERVDMGADFQGRAGDPIFALGPGKIVAAGNQWAGAVGAPYPGSWVAEKIESGPLANRIIYTAEDFTEDVHAGEHVTAQSVIGHFTGAGLLETGFAAPPGTQGETMAAATGEAAPGGDPGAWSTGYGKEIADILHALGAPANPLQPGGVHGPGGGSDPGGGSQSLGAGGCAPAAAAVLLAIVVPGVLELAHVLGLG
jgi:hypothetical protein